MDKLTIKTYPPEIQEQIKFVGERLTELKAIDNPAICKAWLANEIRFQEAIYQSLCVANWVVDASTKSLLDMPGNQEPGYKHDQCWVPAPVGHTGRWTIVKVTRGVNVHSPHILGDVATHAEAIDWASNENFSLGIEDDSIIAELLKGTIFEKEVHHG